MRRPIRFSLNLSPESYLNYYQGNASRVSVVAEDGRRIELPANAFRPFVTPQGVQGRFELLIDEHNRLQELRQLEGP